MAPTRRWLALRSGSIQEEAWLDAVERDPLYDVTVSSRSTPLIDAIIDRSRQRLEAAIRGHTLPKAR